MEVQCTTMFLVFTCIVFSLGDVVVMLYSAGSDRRPSYYVVLFFWAACSTLFVNQMFSSCSMAYGIWGAITAALLTCIFMAETCERGVPLCSQCFPVDREDSVV